MNGLVSVILPVYNVEKYIREAVDSVISQTYKNLEIILVDDGSPDSSGDICDEYAAMDSRVSVIHKENGGVSSARNAGIEAASGDWIYFMDPDDWIELDTIETAVGIAAENECDMCIFDCEIVYKNSRVYYEMLKKEGEIFKSISNNEFFLAYACAGGSACCFITKADLVHKLRFNENIFIREDELFKWQLYGSLSSVCCIRKPLYHYRCIMSSAFNSFDPKKQIDNDLNIYKLELDIINAPGYPENADIAVHSKYLESFYPVCFNIFSGDGTLREKIRDYKNYTSSAAFSDSVCSYSDLYFSRLIKIIFKRKKAPHWLTVYIYIAIKQIQQSLNKRKKF